MHLWHRNCITYVIQGLIRAEVPLNKTLTCYVFPLVLVYQEHL